MVHGLAIVRMRILAVGKPESIGDSHSQGHSHSDFPVNKKQRLAAHLLQSSAQNSPSGRSTPTQGNPQADLLMREVGYSPGQ